MRAPKARAKKKNSSSGLSDALSNINKNPFLKKTHSSKMSAFSMKNCASKKCTHFRTVRF